VETRIENGDPRDVICQAVQKMGVDILVMGSHGYGVIKRWVCDDSNFTFSAYFNLHRVCRITEPQWFCQMIPWVRHVSYVIQIAGVNNSPHIYTKNVNRDRIV